MPSGALLEACDPFGHRLQLVIDWRDDRFGHEWRTSGTDTSESLGTQLLARSTEGTPSDTWPPSPALQQLSVEQHAGRDVALLVGMSGASHWSASIEPVPGAAAFLLDFACRTKGPSPRMGNSYDAIRPAEFSVRFEPEPPAHFISSSNWRRVQIPAHNEPGASTIRWRFRVVLVTAADLQTEPLET